MEQMPVTDLAELDALIRVCPDCDLCQTRTQAVPGDGPPGAQIMFIGEGPGYYEDKSGHPFVGAAGKFLDELLASINLKREDVYITNIVKCRPPNNRDPLTPEIEACRKWLDQQLSLIQPRVIVTLGRISMSRFFPGESISRVHGEPRTADGLTVVPMFHPAAALHQERYRSLIQEDFKRLPAILAERTRQAPTPAPDPTKQMRLF
jgi:uracil-DNA glycosylase family 4